jgi:hypothetical protein
MPVGAGGEELRRIEAALAAEDPALAASFHQWGLPPEDRGDGATVVGPRFGPALLLGLVAIAVGPAVVLVLLLLGSVVLACVATDRWTIGTPARHRPPESSVDATRTAATVNPARVREQRHRGRVRRPAMTRNPVTPPG